MTLCGKTLWPGMSILSAFVNVKLLAETILQTDVILYNEIQRTKYDNFNGFPAFSVRLSTEIR